MNPTVYERHGSLSFAHAKGRKIPYVCRSGNHQGRPGSGRYRVAIAGYPVFDDRNEQLRLCGPCKKQWIEDWESAASGVGVSQTDALASSTRLIPIAGDPVGASA